MYSKDHNINNPTKVDLIDLVPTYSAWSAPSIEHISQKEYDLIAKKDPLTIYVITDYSQKKIYYGDIWINKHNDTNKYFMSIRYGDKKSIKYEIYKNVCIDGADLMVKISEYGDPQYALEALSMYQKVGSHETRNMKLYDALVHYIQNDISCHDILIGILCIYDFDNDYRMPTIIETAVQCDSIHGHDLSDQMKSFIGTYKKYPLRGSAPAAYSILTVKYSMLYDVLLKYNLFKDSKYINDTYNIDLSPVINDIIQVMG